MQSMQRVSKHSFKNTVPTTAITRQKYMHLSQQLLLPPQYQYWPVTVEEGVLLPNAPVLVCGVAVTELAATDYRDGAHMRVMRSTSTFPLVASTDADLFKMTERPILPEELRTPR